MGVEESKVEKSRGVWRKKIRERLLLLRFGIYNRCLCLKEVLIYVAPFFINVLLCPLLSYVSLCLPMSYLVSPCHGLSPYIIVCNSCNTCNTYTLLLLFITYFHRKGLVICYICYMCYIS